MDFFCLLIFTCFFLFDLFVTQKSNKQTNGTETSETERTETKQNEAGVEPKRGERPTEPNRQFSWLAIDFFGAK